MLLSKRTLCAGKLLTPAFTTCNGFTCNRVFGINSNQEMFKVNSVQILQLMVISKPSGTHVYLLKRDQTEKPNVLNGRQKNLNYSHICPIIRSR